MTVRLPLVLHGSQKRQLATGDVLQLIASTTGGASINAPHGAAPTSPVDGDVWTTTAGLYARINGVTIGPYTATSPYTDEQAQDAIGTILTGLTYNDSTPSIAAVRVVQLQLTDPAGSAITTGDGIGYFRVNSQLNGYNLTAVAAALITSSSSGIPTFQIANVTDAVDMLSTKLTIDQSETDSSTAATPAAIDGAHDDVATGDLLRIDCDVAGTGAKGLIIELTFSLP